MAKSIREVLQNHPLVTAAKQRINYSVQLRQHGDKSYRDKIIRFQEYDEPSAWKKVKELYDLESPSNKPMQITHIKSGLYPLYSFANTYSRDWYFVLHWRENDGQGANAEPVTVPIAEPAVIPITHPVPKPIVQPQPVVQPQPQSVPTDHSVNETAVCPF